MKMIRCTPRHSGAILAIFNEAIANSTALYDYKPRTPEMMDRWFDAKAKGNYPVVGAESEDGLLVGFASYGPFRPHAAYKYSVEHSVYVQKDFWGRKLGRFLMKELITAAIEQDYHMMVGAIDAANVASIALHKSLGFSHCATIKDAGFKFGRWLDVEFYQLILPVPRLPVDG